MRPAFEQMKADAKAAGEAFKRDDFDATQLAIAKTDLGKLRPRLREIFQIPDEGRDVYPVLDDMWREFAARSQLSVKRKRKEAKRKKAARGE